MELWCERYSEILCFVLKNYVDRIKQRKGLISSVWLFGDLKDLKQSSELFNVVKDLLEKTNKGENKENIIREIIVEYNSWFSKVNEIQEEIYRLYSEDVFYVKISTLEKIRLYSLFVRYARNKAKKMLKEIT